MYTLQANGLKNIKSYTAIHESLIVGAFRARA